MNRDKALAELTAAILTAKQRLYDYGAQSKMILRIDASAGHLDNLLSRLIEPGKDDLGRALSPPCACGEPIAKGWLYGTSRADGDKDDPNEILHATFSKVRPGWTNEKPVLVFALPTEEGT